MESRFKNTNKQKNKEEAQEPVIRVEEVIGEKTLSILNPQPM